MGRRRSAINAHLPKFVYKRKGGYLFRDKAKNKCYMIGKTEEEMLENYARIKGFRKRETQSDWAKKLFYSVRSNARTRGIDVYIDYNWILSQFESGDRRCAISGIPFDFGYNSKYRRRPFAPSVDRIDSSLPYTPENCRLVCCVANYAMNSWDDEVLIKLAHGVARMNKDSSY